MARKKKEITNQEELENGREGIGNYSNEDGTDRGEAGNPGGGAESSSSREGSSNGGGESRGSENGSEGSKETGRGNLLETIRNRRTKKLVNADAREDETNRGIGYEISSELKSNKRGNESNDAAHAGRSNSESGRDDGRYGNSDSSSGNDSKASKSDRGGVGFNLPPITPPKVTPTKTTEEKVLTKAEGKDLYKDLKESIKIFFAYVDTGISFTNKKQYGQPVKIWAETTDDELSLIASLIIDAGYKSTIAAVAVRKVTKTHKLLALGQMELPKFIKTFQYYQQNGLALPYLNFLGGKS